MPFTVLDPSTAAAAPATTAGTPLVSVGETLLSIRTELLSVLQNRTDVDATRLNKWINWGYRNVSQMIDIKELWASVAFSFVASQPFYLVPASLSWIKRIGVEAQNSFPNTGGYWMELTDEMSYRMLPDTSNAFGTTSPLWPTKYFRYARMLVTWPTPTTAYTAACDFRVRPLDLVNNTDSPILPSEWHEAILEAAKERAFRALKMPNDAALAANDKLAIIRPLVNTDAEESMAMQMTMTPARSRADLRRARTD